MGRNRSCSGIYQANAVRQQNYYELLGINAYETNYAVIRKAYKKMSVKLHPDKNPSPTAQDEFVRLRDAHTAMKDPKMRMEYNVFGESETEMLHYNKVVTYYVRICLWFVLAFYCTSARSVRGARLFAITGVVIGFCLEIFVRTLPKYDLTAGMGAQYGILPQWTGGEKLDLIYELWPVMFGGMLFQAARTYYDKPKYDREMIDTMYAQSAEMLWMLKVVFRMGG